MARVNVEQLALSDGRYATLGRLLGTSKYDALGRMVYVWNECQERGAYYLPGAILDGILDRPDSGVLLVEAELARARKVQGSCGALSIFYIRGSRGRVEWLKKRREDGKKGGRPSKNQVNPRVTIPETLGIDEKQRQDNPPTPTLALTPTDPESTQRAPTGKPRRPAPAAPGCQAFQVHAHDTWQAKHGTKPPWSKAHYAALAKAYHDAGDDQERVTAAWGRFLVSAEKFFAGHDPKRFASALGQFIGSAESSGPRHCSGCNTRESATCSLDGSGVCSACVDRAQFMKAHRKGVNV